MNDDYGRFARWQRALAGLFYNRMPRRFRWAPVLHWLSRNGLASASPFLMLYFGIIGHATAYVAAAVLFGGNVLVGFLGLAAESRPWSNDAHSEAMVRFGDLLSAIRAGAVPAKRRDDAIRACLGLLDVYARRITRTYKGEISVSLVLYVGSGTTKMRIFHRNPGNTRPVDGREFDARQLLGHHACQAGSYPRTVHHLNISGAIFRAQRSRKLNTSRFSSYPSRSISPMEK